MANLERANKEIEPQQGWGFQGEFKRANQQQNSELTNKNKRMQLGKKTIGIMMIVDWTIRIGYRLGREHFKHWGI